MLRITYGSRSFLLTGDMERGIESKLLASGIDLHADVLKVGHHGSRTSSTEPFLEAVSPSIALISAGFENSFGHLPRSGRLGTPHPPATRRSCAPTWTGFVSDPRADMAKGFTDQSSVAGKDNCNPICFQNTSDTIARVRLRLLALAKGIVSASFFAFFSLSESWQRQSMPADIS